MGPRWTTLGLLKAVEANVLSKHVDFHLQEIYTDSTAAARNVKLLERLLRIIIFYYIILVNVAVFHVFQFSNYLHFIKSISIITISAQKKTAEERAKVFNIPSHKSLKLKSGRYVQFQIYIFRFSLYFRNYNFFFF